MILKPEAARAVKDAIDAQFPLWRQVGMTYRDSVKKDVRFRDPEDPSIIFVVLDGITHVVTAGSSNRVFGGGHLSQEHMWTPDHGCAVKGSWRTLDDTKKSMLNGFIHIHRAGQFTTLPEVGGPEREVITFFRSHRGEFSAFYPVVFSRDNGMDYPWRATTRSTGSF